MYDTNLPVMRAWLEAEASEPGLGRMGVAGYEQVGDALAEAIARARGGITGRSEREELRLRAVFLLFQVERFCYFTLIHGWPVDREKGLSALAKSWYEAVYAT